MQAPALQRYRAAPTRAPAPRARAHACYVATTTHNKFLFKEAPRNALGTLCTMGLYSRRRSFQTITLEAENRCCCVFVLYRCTRGQTQWGRTPGRAQAQLPLLAQAMRWAANGQAGHAQDPLWLAATDT